MALFKLIEHPSKGYTKEIRRRKKRQSAGDQLLLHRPMFDPASGDKRGSFVLRGTYVRVFRNRDVLMSFEASNRLTGQGVINTQGAVRFSHFGTGVTFAIVGGTGSFSNAHGTVTAQATGPDTTEFTYDVT